MHFGLIRPNTGPSLSATIRNSKLYQYAVYKRKIKMYEQRKKVVDSPTFSVCIYRVFLLN